MNGVALEWWRKAGQQALKRSAYTEAVAHLGKAVAIADALPDEPGRAMNRLQLQIVYGRALRGSLGHSAPELGLGEEPVIEKSVFSAARAEGFDLGGKQQAIVCGIEAHVCVSQTVHDLLAQGIEVHVPADAVGSRHEVDYERGLERMERAGAVVGTVEAALFELLERAGTPEFKAVQRLIL